MENREVINVLLHHKEAFEISGKTADAIDMAIEALKKQEQDRWIPCRERSPEVGIRYLLLIKNDYERRKKMNDTEWHGGYYSPNPDYKEDESIYHSYHTYDSFRYRMEHIMEFDDDGKVVREDNG